jgi:hypothetical protein
MQVAILTLIVGFDWVHIEGDRHFVYSGEGYVCDENTKGVLAEFLAGPKRENVDPLLLPMPAEPIEAKISAAEAAFKECHTFCKHNRFVSET